MSVGQVGRKEVRGCHRGVRRVSEGQGKRLVREVARCSVLRAWAVRWLVKGEGGARVSVDRGG